MLVAGDTRLPDAWAPIDVCASCFSVSNVPIGQPSTSAWATKQSPCPPGSCSPRRRKRCMREARPIVGRPDRRVRQSGSSAVRRGNGRIAERACTRSSRLGGESWRRRTAEGQGQIAGRKPGRDACRAACSGPGGDLVIHSPSVFALRSKRLNLGRIGHSRRGYPLRQESQQPSTGSIARRLDARARDSGH